MGCDPGSSFILKKGGRENKEARRDEKGKGGKRNRERSQFSQSLL